MTKRVFIVHGWDGHPEEGCFPWLKKELQGKGFEVSNPAMPEPLHPKIDGWVSYLKKQIGAPDKDTILLGHSLGAQTVLRYLESLGENEQVGGAVLLAGFVHLTEEANEDEEDAEIGKPWLETPLDWAAIKSHSKKFVAIFSDDDPLVPLSDSEIFHQNLGAKIIIEHGKGHFSGSDGVTELPSALKSVLDMSH